VQNGQSLTVEGETMDIAGRFYVRITEGKIARRCFRVAASKGQTMTEYAMIVSVVAVVAYAGYLAFGTSTNTLLTSIDGSL
jgi:Flp pilus assembly pilin Flp